jgi:membrane associated rhomboid family serine protease
MGVLFPNLRLMLLFPPIPMKAKYFVLLYGAYEVYAEIIQKAGDNIAHAAHLGGMLFAYILIRYWGLRTVH